MKKIQEDLSSELAEMNDIIVTQLATTNRMMNDIVSRYLQVKGKQIRPILVILSARMFGAVSSEVLLAGAALEMLHNASLIHDDIVDETALRRGVATINATMGNHIAVLVGDFFVSNALAAGIRTGDIRVISALSALGKELSLGEIDQICNAREHSLEESSYISMIRQKTASLFMNCARMGAELGGADETQQERLVAFAELLGLCFQIKDDIFDYFDDKRIGKPTGNDLREGKVTLPLLYALSNAPQEKSEPMRQILSEGNLTADNITRLIEFAKSNGGIEYAYSRMRAMQQEAMKILEELPSGESKRDFELIFDYIIERHT
ncbi:MAG: polyprenyl synthetase family protein [Bacteroidales bacterium]|nr:polyprenyl synthetase family protein [Bacteroidales bacterium]MBD5206183.1 polyprenyl synthetase family protein [Bacteroidales bacterium]MBD5223248.1 polyprenyl synthetase family protein [Bacteroidales bacterium]MBD5302927.1 polyprenyl synthetase family protein [Bacteroides sp.]